MLMMMIGAVCTSCATFKSQKAVIELGGNPTTGYTWNYQIEDEAVIKVDEEIRYLGKNGVVGAPSKFTYTIYSLKAGNTKIKFEYKRPWEQTPADKVVIYEVRVKENGAIEVKESGDETGTGTEVETGTVSGAEPGTGAGAESAAFKMVSMDEGLKLMSKDSDFVLLDVRRPDEFEAGHIPGAVQLTNETMTEENTLAVLPDKNQTVYVYCRSGRRSKLASQKLINYGYKNVIEIGGILDYKGEIE